MSALKIYADAVKEDFPELTPVVDNMLMMANARIAELEAALATARREGMEEAARIAENEPEPEGEPPIELHGRSVKNIAISSVRATKHSIAAAIRAALEEGKKDER